MPSWHNDAAIDDKVTIDGLDARAYKIPTARPEADGTLEWDSTVMVTVTVSGGGQQGFGYTYASRASATLIEDSLYSLVIGCRIFDIPHIHRKMCAAVRNFGLQGISACAISAVDNALWDLKAKLTGLPIVSLLGSCRSAIEVYGSGGFTTSDSQMIAHDIDEWRKLGIKSFKIKIGRDRAQDMARINAAVARLPDDGELFVDANGAYCPHKALTIAAFLRDKGVTWFEEPVPSLDEQGMLFVRDHAPAGLAIAAGEYGFIASDFKRLLDAGAVDVLQADATRCLGVTGFLKAATLADSYQRPLSAHCAPALHAALMCHADNAMHLEYFSDHARIEAMLFEGAPQVIDGFITPQTKQPGFGLTFKTQDAEQYAL